MCQLRTKIRSNKNIMTEMPATTNTDYPDELCSKDDVMKIGSILIPLFFSLLVVLSCVGNMLVLVILVLYEKLTNLTNVLILNLALSDLLFTFGLPFWASYYIWGWTFGDMGCKAVKFVFYAGFYSSVLFLTLMTVQRYMAVVHPLSDWERCRGFSIAPIIIVWLLSGAAALPGSLRSKVMSDEMYLYCEYDSFEVKHAIVYLQNVFFLCAFCIIGFCHIKMFQTISQSRTKKRHKTIKLLFCVGLVFFIGWAPYNIVMLLRTLMENAFYSATNCNESIRLDYTFYASRMLAFSHCCLNPVLYVLVAEKFLNHLRAILKKVCSK